MKNIIIALVFVSSLIMVGCGDDCDKENPTVVLTNNGTAKADIQVKTSNGNTENLNNIESGTSSAKRSFAPGKIEFTISIQGVNDPIEYELESSYCNEYTVTINEDNTVSGSVKKLDKLIVM